MANPPKVSNCETCEIAATALAPEFHPESDVGPWDGACQTCGHLGHHNPGCPDENPSDTRTPVCPQCGWLATFGQRTLTRTGDVDVFWCPNAHHWRGKEDRTDG